MHFLYYGCICRISDALSAEGMHVCVRDQLQMKCSEDNALLILFRAIPVKGNTHQRLVNPVNGHQFGRRLLVWH